MNYIKIIMFIISIVILSYTIDPKADEYNNETALFGNTTKDNAIVYYSELPMLFYGDLWFWHNGEKLTIVLSVPNVEQNSFIIRYIGVPPQIIYKNASKNPHGVFYKKFIKPNDMPKVLASIPGSIGIINHDIYISNNGVVTRVIIK